VENSKSVPTIGPKQGDAVTLKPFQANGREFDRFVGEYGIFQGVFPNGMAYVQFQGQPWPYPCLLESLEAWPNTTSLDIRVQIDAEMARLGLRWRGPRLRAWMQRLSQELGTPVLTIADVPLPAMVSLLKKLRSEPTQLSLEEVVNHG
jgi:hypothetical protein